MAPTHSSSISVATTASKPMSRRKRKLDQEALEKLTAYGVDLLDIPGLPIQIIPLQVQAIKTTTKYFKSLNPGECITPFIVSNVTNKESTSVDQQSKSKNNEDGIVDSILGRIHQASSSTEPAIATDTENNSNDTRNGRQTQLQRLHAKNQATDSWLDAIYRDVRSSGQHSFTPVAAIQHLWNTSLDFSSSNNHQIALCRAAWNLLGHLVCKSAQARQWLLQDPIESGDDSNSRWLEWTSNERQFDNNVDYRCLKKEGYILLQHLHQSGYAQHYPSILVIQRRLIQTCPYVMDHEIQTSLTGHGMMDYRRWRDLALEHSSQVEQRVLRLLNRCDECLEILVPRFVQDITNQNSRAPIDNSSTQIHAFKSDEENDEHIDWEEGYDEENDFANFGDSEQSHAAAVEQTLSVLQATGRLQEGGMTIDLSSSANTDSALPEKPLNNNQIQARVRLESYAKKLSQSHLPRLSHWIQGLLQADNLVQAPYNPAVSVSLTHEKQEKRKLVLDQLMNIKNAVSSTLAAARKLGIENDDQTLNTESNEHARPLPSLNSNLPGQSTGQKNNSNRSKLMNIVQHKKPPATSKPTQRSTHINIKYRKN